MSREREDKLAALLRDLLFQPEAQPAELLSRKAIPAWDSLLHIKIVLAVQKEFSVRFSAAEMIRLDSYAAFREALAAKNS